MGKGHKNKENKDKVSDTQSVATTPAHRDPVAPPPETPSSKKTKTTEKETAPPAPTDKKTKTTPPAPTDKKTKTTEKEAAPPAPTGKASETLQMANRVENTRRDQQQLPPGDQKLKRHQTNEQTPEQLEKMREFERDAILATGVSDSEASTVAQVRTRSKSARPRTAQQPEKNEYAEKIQEMANKYDALLEKNKRIETENGQLKIEIKKVAEDNAIMRQEYDARIEMLNNQIKQKDEDATILINEMRKEYDDKITEMRKEYDDKITEDRRLGEEQRAKDIEENVKKIVDDYEAKISEMRKIEEKQLEERVEGVKMENKISNNDIAMSEEMDEKLVVLINEVSVLDGYMQSRKDMDERDSGATKESKAELTRKITKEITKVKSAIRDYENGAPNPSSELLEKMIENGIRVSTLKNIGYTTVLREYGYNIKKEEDEAANLGTGGELSDSDEDDTRLGIQIKKLNTKELQEKENNLVDNLPTRKHFLTGRSEIGEGLVHQDLTDKLASHFTRLHPSGNLGRNEIDVRNKIDFTLLSRFTHPELGY